MAGRKGLYANINAKKKRIKAGSGERMRKPGTKGAPKNSDFFFYSKNSIYIFDINHNMDFSLLL